jgi:hypothetical protein
MSATSRWNVNGEMERLAGSFQTIAANATTAFDFGTPNDIKLSTLGLNHGDRVLIHISAVRAAGTTSTLAFTIQDADDNAGSIGTPATATTSGTAPVFATDSGAIHQSAVVSVQVKHGRPWLRINAVHGVAGTDSFQCHCTVYGVKQ